MISTYDEFLARLDASGKCTADDIAGWREMAARDPAMFEAGMRSWIRDSKPADKTFWQETMDLLDPASDIASKLIPIVTLALMV